MDELEQWALGVREGLRMTGSGKQPKLPSRYCGLCETRVKQMACPLCGADTDKWPKGADDES